MNRITCFEDNKRISWKNTNDTNKSESCINDEIPKYKCVNGPIKGDIALHKQ